VINGYEIVVLLVIVAVVVGPERLPAYAKELAALVRRGRELLRDTQNRVSAELGDAGEDVDWAALDPRKYDPRRIVREALRDDPPPRRPGRSKARQASTTAPGTPEASPDVDEPDQRTPAGAPVFDDEAT